MRKSLLTVAAMVIGQLLWLLPVAHADLLSTYNVDGGGTTTGCTATSGTNCNYSVTVSGVTITQTSAQSNSPGGGTPCINDACVTSSAVSITNSGTSNATIVLVIGDINFTSPTGFVSLLSNIGGTVFESGAANLLSYTSCIDTANGQNVCPGTNNAPTLTANITALGSYNVSSINTFDLLTSPYSMTELIDLTLAPGSSINFSASTTLVTAVPEPASLMLFGAGLLGIGVFCGYRRKRA